MRLLQRQADQKTTPEDIAIFLDTLWTRIAFHAYVMIVGLGGWRNTCVLNLPYEQVCFAIVRDPDTPKASKLVSQVLVY